MELTTLQKQRIEMLGHLLEGRGAVLPGFEQQVSDQTDFELITWLVIR